MMARQPRIVIADRSELAGNLYRLLLAPIGATLVVRRRFEEARPHFFRREKVDLGIFNSNIFGKKFEEIAKKFVEDEPLSATAKIFICRESPAEEEWRKSLGGLPNTTVIVRPFHPDELAALVDRLVGQEWQ